MLSKSQIRLLTSLQNKKFRREEMLFLAEGEKLVSDAVASGWNIVSVFCTQEFILENKDFPFGKIATEIITADELKRISPLTTPQEIIALIEIPSPKKNIEPPTGRSLLLDNVSDPGNMGTILRIADWFGIDQVICSLDCVDLFNPKVVQGSMGSIFRVNAASYSLMEVLDQNKNESVLPVYATVLDGTPVGEFEMDVNAFLILGNESSGIRDDLRTYFTKKLSIPKFSGGKIDSLNVGVAAGIFCSYWRR